MMTIHVQSKLDSRVIRRLQALILRLRAFLFLEGALWVLLFLFVGAWVQFGLDYAGRGLRFSMRAALLGGLIAGALWLVWRRIIQPLQAKVGLPEAARLIERRHPELSSILISAVRFSTDDVGPQDFNSPALMASVVGSTPRAVEPINFLKVLDAKRARRHALWFGAVVVLASAILMRRSVWFVKSVR